MKTNPILLVLLLTATSLWAQTPTPPGAPAPAPTPGLRRAAASGLPAVSSPDAATVPVAAASTAVPAPVAEVPAYDYNFSGVDVAQVLDIYADLIERTQLRAPGIAQTSVTLKTHG